VGVRNRQVVKRRDPAQAGLRAGLVAGLLVQRRQSQEGLPAVGHQRQDFLEPGACQIGLPLPALDVSEAQDGLGVVRLHLEGPLQFCFRLVETALALPDLGQVETRVRMVAGQRRDGQKRFGRPFKLSRHEQGPSEIRLQGHVPGLHGDDRLQLPGGLDGVAAMEFQDAQVMAGDGVVGLNSQDPYVARVGVGKAAFAMGLDGGLEVGCILGHGRSDDR